MKKIISLFSFVFLSFFSITNILSQTIIVDSLGLGDYSTLSDAISNIKTYSGNNLIIQVKEAIYEEQVTIDSIGYQGFPTSLVIQSFPGNTNDAIFKSPAGLTSSNNYIFKINNCQNLTVENIEFQNINVDYSHCFDFSGYNNTVKINNCKFSNSTKLGIDKNTAIIFFDNGSDNYNTIFTNNIFNNGSYGIYAHNSQFDGQIENNNFEDFEGIPIYINGGNNINIIKNTLNSKKISDHQQGIFIDSAMFLKISQNNIIIEGSISNDGIICNHTDSITISNNMISISGTGLNTGASIQNAKLDFVFNSLYIPSGNNQSTGLKLKTCTSARILNNIFDTYSGYCLNFDANFYSDYNVFNYNASNYFAKYMQNDISNLTDWQNNPPNLDYNSLLGDPSFFSSSDLHTGNAQLVEGKGVYNTKYKIDFDGDARMDPPDIGADQIKSAVHNNITSDTIWSGYVFIDTTITISANVTLTILPGTNIGIADSVAIFNYGTIKAQGTKSAGITFAYVDNINGEKTSMPTYWKGIKNATSAGNIFEYCFFQNATETALSFDNNPDGVINNCQFDINQGQIGGAINSVNSNISIINSDFYSNSAIQYGGAIYVNDSSIIANCIFQTNQAQLGGGDIYFDNSSASVVNNVFLDSWSDTNAKSLEVFNSTSVISNSIFWGFSSGDTIINVSGSSTPKIRNIDIFGGHAAMKFSTGADTNLIFNKDPIFVDQYSNYRLQPSSPLINKGNSNYFYPTDKDGKVRPYNSGITDIGAYEYQGTAMTSFAGKDTVICANSLNLYAQDPTPYKGKWSSTNPNINFQDENNPKTKVFNLNFGQNFLIWTVTNNVSQISDTVVIYNNKPPSLVGNDISLVSNNYPVLITDTLILAMDPSPFFGMWTSPDAGLLIQSPTNLISLVSNLKRGKNIFLWTVDNAGCKNIDTLIVTSGFSVYPTIAVKDNWSNPNIWNIGAIPGQGDSVNITGSNILIDGPNAECGKLVLSSSSLILNGSAKGPARLTTDKIYIEQNAEKKYLATGDTAKLVINNGQIFISDAANKLTDGLIVGSTGDVVVEPTNGGIAEIHLGKNRQLRVEAQAVYKTASGTGQVNIRNGGKIYIEQNAEKGDAKSFNKNVYVSSGGKIYIEQNAEKKAAGNSELIVGKGNRIYIEQNAEKKAYEGGKIVINGGKIYIEQNAEKNAAKNNFYEVNVHRGGKIYIEQNAEKKYIDSSVLEAPRILIDNGQIFVGSNSVKKGKTAKIRGNKIYIEQNAEKVGINDTALVIGSSGRIDLKSTPYMKGGLYLGSFNFLTIKNGGIITFADSCILEYQSNSSIIDYGNNTIPAIEYYPFYDSEISFFSAPVNQIAVNNLSTNLNISSWFENSNTFNLLNQTDFLQKATGYKIENSPSPIVQEFSGILNTGNINVALTNANQGINLIGNPYPSKLLINNLVFAKEVQNSIYLFDPNINNFIVLQQNGLNINQTDPVINQNSAFYTVTNASSNFVFTSNAQTHYYESVKSTNTQNYITFKVYSNNSSISDGLGLIFKNIASNNYYNKEDALKLENIQNPNYLNCYTYSDDNKKLSINTLQVPADNSTIPIYVNSDQAGSYYFYMDSINLNGNAKVYLINPENNDTTDLSINQYIDFNYNTPNVEKEFLLLFKGQILNLDEKINQHLIYSFNKNIYVDAKGQNINKVEIYNVAGVKVYQKNINTDKTIINTNLENGIYFVRAYLNDKIINQKLSLF